MSEISVVLQFFYFYLQSWDKKIIPIYFYQASLSWMIWCTRCPKKSVYMLNYLLVNGHFLGDPVYIYPENIHLWPTAWNVNRISGYFFNCYLYNVPLPFWSLDIPIPSDTPLSSLESVIVSPIQELELALLMPFIGHMKFYKSTVAFV